MITAIKLVAILAIANPAHMQAPKYQNQAAYESFLAGIKFQEDRAKERQKQKFYIPEVRDLRYEVDEYGQEYVVCRNYTYSDLDGGIIEKCLRNSPLFDPVCFVTINYTNETISGECIQSPLAATKICAPKCEIKKKYYQSPSDPTKEVAIGTCCCTGRMCNSDYKDIIRRDLAARVRERRNAEGFSKSIDSSFLESFL